MDLPIDGPAVYSESLPIIRYKMLMPVTSNLTGPKPGKKLINLPVKTIQFADPTGFAGTTAPINIATFSTIDSAKYLLVSILQIQFYLWLMSLKTTPTERTEKSSPVLTFNVSSRGMVTSNAINAIAI